MRFSSPFLFLLWATLFAIQVRCDVPYPGPEWTDALFIDDFSGSKGSLPDGATWMLDTGTSYPGGPPQWGTGEIETYSDKPRYVHQTGEGHLKIIPRYNNGTWTSARIETRQMDFAAPRHGKLRVEASLSAPAVDSSNGLGYWPAFWVLGSGVRNGKKIWPLGGEFDIMEMVNGQSGSGHGMHCGVNPGGPCHESEGIYSFTDCQGSSCWGNFHTYSMVIDRSVKPEAVEFSVDGVVSFRITEDEVGTNTWRQAVHRGHFIVANVAMGGAMPNAVAGYNTPGSSTVPGRAMIFDYVAVWTTGRTQAAPFEESFGWPFVD